MAEDPTHDATRRRVLRTILLAPTFLASPSFLANCGGAAEAGTLLSPTPACDDGDEDDPTLAQTEGPYFTPNSPERTSLLEAGVAGTSLVLTGLVLTRSCRPVSNALLDASDRIFDSSLLMELSGTASAREARFNFVLNIA